MEYAVYIHHLHYTFYTIAKNQLKLNYAEYVTFDTVNRWNEWIRNTGIDKWGIYLEHFPDQVSNFLIFFIENWFHVMRYVKCIRSFMKSATGCYKYNNQEGKIDWAQTWIIMDGVLISIIIEIQTLKFMFHQNLN